MPEVTIRKTRSYAPITAEVTCEVYEQIEKLITLPKSPAQLIREQLESEGMTVKQILENNSSTCYVYNVLTPIEARRREVERAAVLVREREPSERKCDVSAWYEAEDSFHASVFNAFTIGELKMQSKEQWHLLRDVIGDEGLRELIQK